MGSAKIFVRPDFLPYLGGMAFLRVEKKKSGTYLRIVQSYKKDGKPRHKTLYSLGKVEDYPPEQLEKIAHKLLELAGRPIPKDVDMGLREIGRFNYGYALVLNWLWKRYDLSDFLTGYFAKRKLQYDFGAVFRLLLAERLNEPCSKLGSHGHQTEYIGLAKVELHHLYRSLDELADMAAPLQQHLYRQQRNLFNLELDVVFYDVTTLYFDSQKQVDGALRQKGYSKDGKHHKVQVVQGLLVDKQRNPIAYRVYEGNKYEGHTLENAIADLKSAFPVDRVITVADRGMLSNDNIEKLKGQCPYIIGERLKNLPRKIQDVLMDTANHRPVFKGTEGFTYATTVYNGKNIICTWSQKRAKKDCFDRQRLEQKARQLLEQPHKIKQKNKRGAQKYIQNQGKDTYTFDEERLKKDSRYDGFLAIATDIEGFDPATVIQQYNQLFEVEHAFRVLKSVLEIRPVFHWTDKRIQGHIALCFTAYSLLNDMTKMLACPENPLIRTLDKMQVSLVEQTENNQRFYLRANIDENTARLIKKLKLVVPKDTTPENLIQQYFEQK